MKKFTLIEAIVLIELQLMVVISGIEAEDGSGKNYNVKFTNGRRAFVKLNEHGNIVENQFI